MSCTTNRLGAAGLKTVEAAEAILRTMRAARAELGIGDLLDHLAEQGLDEAATKAALTQLLAESRIRMTAQRKLLLAQDGL